MSEMHDVLLNSCNVCDVEHMDDGEGGCGDGLICLMRKLKS